MKKRNEKIVGASLLAMIVVLMSISVAAAVPWEGYLVPQDSAGFEGTDTEVPLKADVTATNVVSYQVNIYFDTDIVNITDVDWTGSPFTSNMWHHYGNYIRVGGISFGSAGIPTDTHTLCTLTFIGKSSGVSNIFFTHSSVIDPDGNPIASTYTNGTYTCTFEYPPLSITASPTEVINCTSTDVLFTVESASTPVSGATVTVNGCGVDVSGTTDAAGQVTIEIHCTTPGTITATASKGGYTSATTTMECNLAPPPGKVVINEFVANPNITQTSEWIELYNPTGSDVSLDGWTIEDDVGNSLADLSGEIVPANDYLMFNFSNKLNDGGDIIYLNTSTTTVDSVTYGDWDDGNKDDNAPKPGIDNSTGRYPNGQDTDVDIDDFREFGIPTPGESNVISKVVISIGTVVGDMTAPIRIDNASNIGCADINVTYNSSVCVITDVTNGSFDVTLANLEQNETGWVRIGAFQTENPGLNGGIILAYLTFRGNSTSGTSPLNLTVNTLTDATPQCNDIPYIVKQGIFFAFLNGDVNGDGKVDLADAMYLAKHVLGITGFEQIVEEAADVNGDDKINLADAMYLAKHVLGIQGFEELK